MSSAKSDAEAAGELPGRGAGWKSGRLPFMREREKLMRARRPPAWFQWAESSG